MVKKGPRPQEVKSYVPSKWLKSFLDEKLLLLKKNESSRTWDKKKVDNIDKMFRSMADLIYFLEMTAKHSELREVFEKDLEDLLDTRPDSKMKNLSSSSELRTGGIKLTQTNLVRLVYASLIPYQEDHDDFRLKLVHKIQGIIFDKTWSVLEIKFGVSQISGSIVGDMKKCIGWTALLAGSKDYEKTTQKRIIDFPAVNAN